MFDFVIIMFMTIIIIPGNNTPLTCPLADSYVTGSAGEAGAAAEFVKRKSMSALVVSTSLPFSQSKPWAL